MIDEGKLDSAVAAVQATFGGELLLPTVADVAASYWFGICQAHAFMDGNKRAAVLSVDMFLQMNWHELDLTAGEVEDLTLRAASREIRSREELQELMRLRPVDPDAYG